jgi:VWFA-related protein
MRLPSIIAAIGLVAAAGAPGLSGQAAQQPPPQPAPAAQEQPRPVIRRGINYVGVDVIVTDRQGNPVLDLTPEDFEVFEDGERQQVESFQLIRIDQATAALNAPVREIRSRADEEREAERPDVRIFALFLDDYHVRRGASLGVRDPLMKFIEQHIAPADLVGIMYPLTPVTDFQLTRNHQAIADAIRRFEGRKFNYEPRNAFEEQYAYYPAAQVERIRNQVSLSALKALAVHLGGLREGRKAIVYVSEGFTSTLPPQLSDPVAALPGVGNPNRRNPGAGSDDPRRDSVEFFNSVDLLSDMREVFDAANRANAAIYALDPRGLAAFEYDINEGVGTTLDMRGLQSSMDTLRVLADNTDGRAIVNRNDLDGGLRQIVRDSSAYYLIGYNSTRAPSDGKFHEIKVRLRRPGLQVRARKGYWALTAEETATASAPPKPGPPPAVQAALTSLAAAARRSLVRTWVGTSRAETGRTRVTFVWEPVAPAPGAGARADDPPARVAVTALAPSGQPYFRGKVAAPRTVTFEADPGQMQVRLNIENERGQVLDAEQRELTVPDFTRTEVSIATPQILRARTLRELNDTKADPRATPTVDREFRRTERLLVRFEAYAPGGATPAVTARLLNRQGAAMADLTLAPPAPGAAFQIEVPVANLAPGEYVVAITATSDKGSAQEMIAIRVTS